MLDGLDEVQTKDLESCIRAINAFLTGENQTYCVVCSRTATYASVPTRLQLNSAISLNSLTQNQILNYFSSHDYPELEQVIRDDPTFLETVSTPLLLSIATSTYREVSSQATLALKSSNFLNQLDSSQTESISQLVYRAKQVRERSTSYRLKFTTPTELVSIGEAIQVSVELLPYTDHEDDNYCLKILHSAAAGNDLSILLNASGFQFDSVNVASLPIRTADDIQDYSKALGTARFTLTALQPGSNEIRADIYYGETLETVLEAVVQVSSLGEPASYLINVARSRPVPQPDLILQIQTAWNENLSICTFRYHLDSFHPRLSFASDMQQRSDTMTAGWLEQARNLLQATLEDTANSLPEDFRSRLSSLGQYLFQQLLPLELQDTLRSVRRFNQPFTLLILVDQDAGFPWELLHDGQSFLGERLTIGRWSWELERTRPYEFAIGAVNMTHYADVEQPEQWASLLEPTGAPPSMMLSGGVLAELNAVEAMWGLHLLRRGQSVDEADRQDAPVLVDNSGARDLEQDLQPAKLSLRRNRPLVTLGYVNAGVMF